MTTTGILLFDGVEELDFAGPWEVLTMAKLLRPDDRVVTIARSRDAVRCAKGMRVLADHGFDDAPALDVLLVPGGDGTRPLMKDREVLAFVQRCAARAQWTTSVCSGALVLAAAGLLDGRDATTHWAVLPELRVFEKVNVLEHVRYVRDGQIVSSAGVSAGIDMALWLLGQLASPAEARKVQRLMQYDPAPPYRHRSDPNGRDAYRLISRGRRAKSGAWRTRKTLTRLRACVTRRWIPGSCARSRRPLRRRSRWASAGSQSWRRAAANRRT